jgi:hypothetical protein
MVFLFSKLLKLETQDFACWLTKVSGTKLCDYFFCESMINKYFVGVKSNDGCIYANILHLYFAHHEMRHYIVNLILLWPSLEVLFSSSTVG